MDEIDFHIERSILKIGNRVISQRTDDLKFYNLTSSQSETLLFFDSNPGAMVLDLKEHLKISHQAARNIIVRMKEKDLLSVTVSATDGRARQIFLTEKGTEICTKLKKKAGNIGNNLLSGFSDDEKHDLYMFLSRIIENI